MCENQFSFPSKIANPDDWRPLTPWSDTGLPHNRHCQRWPPFTSNAEHVMTRGTGGIWLHSSIVMHGNDDLLSPLRWAHLLVSISAATPLEPNHLSEIIFSVEGVLKSDQFPELDKLMVYNMLYLKIYWCWKKVFTDVVWFNFKKKVGKLISYHRVAQYEFCMSEIRQIYLEVLEANNISGLLETTDAPKDRRPASMFLRCANMNLLALAGSHNNKAFNIRQFPPAYCCTRASREKCNQLTSGKKT